MRRPGRKQTPGPGGRAAARLRQYIEQRSPDGGKLTTPASSRPSAKRRKEKGAGDAKKKRAQKKAKRR